MLCLRLTVLDHHDASGCFLAERTWCCLKLVLRGCNQYIVSTWVVCAYHVCQICRNLMHNWIYWIVRVHLSPLLCLEDEVPQEMKTTYPTGGGNVSRTESDGVRGFRRHTRGRHMKQSEMRAGGWECNGF